ncbi:NAD-dependent epimerase/dehydratase family protein [Candidatus Bipolaricaulota bacterium]|nr:NAD-dependent epimerase/dehydratase family protein [Candidatus Bipolaricaulota bacterium]TFH09102.1 MAG: NAD-dependent epimerase/dehydratase family protein [Candidatus Atribacteria bacterium]
MNLEGKRVLVIGGAGFIGSHIVDQLLEEPVSEILVFDNFVRGTRANLDRASADARLRIIEGSIMDRQSLAAVMDGIDGVFHLAALWLFECVHEPRAALEVNVDGTYNVISAALEAGVQRVVYSSSASVYGDALASPMTEDHPFNNRTTYGATKIAGEQFFRAFYEQHGLPFVGLRYMNVYGPRMDYRGAYVSVIMKVLDRIFEGMPPLIFGDGSQAYDFIHVADAARANVLAMTSDVSDEFFNVGTGVRTTIKELVQLLLRATGSSVEPEYRPSEQSFVTERVGSTEKAERMLGYRSSVSLDEGIRALVQWRTQT